MKWFIPAKTFLLGEYLAVANGPALLLTTNPCFELSLSNSAFLQGIHMESPAGRLWAQSGYQKGLSFFDPYAGLGGLGASSAQFLGAFWAIEQQQLCQRNLLETYHQFAWAGIGLRPSGYDVLAQSLATCVYISQNRRVHATYAWPFDDVAFVLLHTGQKLATHLHLQKTSMPAELNYMDAIVERGRKAFETVDSALLVEAVNDYNEQLMRLNLVAKHSKKALELLKKDKDVLAAKGCGAMGADVLLLLVSQVNCSLFVEKLAHQGWSVLATSADLYHQE